MTSGRSNVRSIFGRAQDIESPTDRAAYLDAACGGDAELRAEVDELLAACDQAGSFMQATDGWKTPTSAIEPLAEVVGTVIGPYKLLQQIGEGGMGAVFMAEQTRPVVRRVALKIIKPGMDSRQVISRFEAERQALALMDHPNIARVLDAGATESGRPYFVMELVKGTPITEYCDARQLTPRERLELFVPVCQAVHHAHQKGIIHRDLKPSNVLVAEYDARATPKVIDFGVAKAVGQRLTEHTLFTQYGQIVGTFEYMSPEQARLNQLDVDTRSDIYSLGVILYELLAGSTPFDKERLRSAAFDEILRIVREEEPPCPSVRLSSNAALPSIAANRHTEPARLNRLVRGELDWIVMKCLEKERNRRYETANGLAHDVEHYLADEPVRACPPSAWYRLRKVVRRNKLVVAAGAAVAGALLVGAIVSAYFAVHANQRAVEASISAEIAEGEKLRADKTAVEAAQQREQARDSLCRSLYDQARILLASAQSGRRWHSLSILRQAESLRSRPRNGASTRSAEYSRLPTRADLRSEAVGALLTPDLRAVREIKISDFSNAFGGFSPAVSADGWLAVGAPAMHDRPQELSADLQAKLPLDAELAGLTVVDLARNRELLSPQGQGLPTSFDLSRDGKLFAVGNADRQGYRIKVWETTALRAKPHVLRWPQYTASDVDAPLSQLLFSSHGRLIAVVRHGNTQVDFAVWDLRTGECKTQRLEQEEGQWGRSAFTPDGKRLAIRTGPKRAILWNLSSDKQEVAIELPKSFAGDMDFSPSEQLIAVGCDDLTTDGVIIWDYAQKKERARIKSISGYGALAFHPSGKWLAFGADRDISVYELPEFKRIARAQRVVTQVNQLQWSSDGKRLISVDLFGTLKAWQCNLEPPITKTTIAGPPIVGFEFSPNGKWLGVWDEKSARLVDRVTGKVKQSYDGRHWIYFDPNSQQMAVVAEEGKPTVVEDLATGKEVFSQKTPSHWHSAAFNRGGELLLAVGGWAEGAVWNLATNKVVWEDQVDRTYPVPTLSDDGRYLATATRDEATASSSVVICEMPSGSQIAQLDQPGDAEFVFSPDGRWAALFSSLELYGAAAKPSGQTVGGEPDVGATGSQAKREVTVFRMPGATKHFTIPCADRVSGGFSADGQLAAFSTEEGYVQLWDTQSGAELFHFRPPGKPLRQQALFTPDGRYLAWCGQVRVDGQSTAVMHYLDLPVLQQQLAKVGFEW